VSKGPTEATSARARLRRWWPWLVLSAILHLPFTPIGPLLGLLTLLLRLHTGVPNEPVEELVGIPVELLADPAPMAEVPPPATAEGAAVVVTPPKPKPPKAAFKDAGAPDASTDAGVADAAVAVDLDGGLADADTSPTDASTADAGVGGRDPFAIAGELGKFQKGNVNVQIHLFVEPLKHHPAGRVIAGFLSQEPQWQEFLGPGGLDLLNNFSRIVIMAPQLIPSTQAGAFVEYTGDASLIRNAVDALVERSEGAHWETKNKKPVAYVNLAGGERVFILYPNHGVAIVPPKAAEQLIALTRFPPLAKPTTDEEVLQLMLKTPHRVRAFKHFGVAVPTSISMARVFVGGTPNGGAEIRLELEDESPQAAAAHAPDLEQDLAKVTMGLFSLRLNPEGSRILGEARLSPLIVGGVLREIQKRLPPRAPNP
jgi:hypothetical protein